MTIKLARIYLFIFVVFTLLWTQHANSIAQKIAIENSYQQKVSAAISSLLGDEKFLVIVSIEFSTIGGMLKKNTTPQSGTSSQGTYIPAGNGEAVREQPVEGGGARCFKRFYYYV